MVFENLTMNFSALGNITPLNINLTNASSLGGVVNSANSVTNDLLIFGSLFIITIVVYLVLSDKTPFTDFGYNDLRAFHLALAYSIFMGLTIIEIGWSNNFVAIGMFTSIYLLTFIGVAIGENKE